MLEQTDATAALIATLRARGDATSGEAAGLIEWFLDERPTLIAALEQEREDAKHFQALADKQTAALVRIAEHFDTLGKFAMGDIADPWPDPEPKKRSRK